MKSNVHNFFWICYTMNRMTWLNWKKWPYWLRGGVILGGVSFLSIGVTFLCFTDSNGYGFDCFDFFVPVVYLPGLFLQFYASVFNFGDPGLFSETHMLY